MRRIFVLFLALIMITAMFGCGSKQEPTSVPTEEIVQTPEKVDLQALYDSMAEILPEMILLDESMMLDYCGISAEYYTEAVVAICADGLRTDEVWLIKAADEAALDKLEEMAETRLRMKGEESISYSPEQYAVVEKAEQVKHGLYFMLIVSPDVDGLTDMAIKTIS